MLTGTLIAESLRVGTTIDGVTLTVRKIARYAPGDTTPDQPAVWTSIDFEAADADARPLAEALAAVLAESGGWYANFGSATEAFVIYHGKIFLYPRGDAEGRASAQAYGRLMGVPEPQLDWTD
jgi:hypothetical protein